MQLADAQIARFAVDVCRMPRLDATRIGHHFDLASLSPLRALLALRRVLARGEIVGLLLDEDERRNPLFTPFLGTLAATSPVAAFLQRVSGAPIVVVSCERTGRTRFRLRVWRVLRPRSTDDRDAALRAVTFEINQALGEAILDRPDQWLWGSRPFATRPPGERAGPDGLSPPADAVSADL